MRKSVSNKLLQCSIEHLQKCGLDWQHLLASCGINEFEASRQDGRLSAAQHYRFWQQIHQYSNDLGTLFNNDPAPFHALFPDLFGPCLNAENALDAVRAFVHFRFIMGDCDHCSVENSDNLLRIEYVSEGPRTMANGSALGNFSMILGFISDYLDSYQCQIFLPNPATHQDKAIADALSVECRFDQGNSYMMIHSQQLNAPYELYNRQLANMQQNALLKYQTIYLPHHSFSEQVREVIEQHLEHGHFDSESSLLDLICSQFNMSRWTLNNRLKHHDQSFTQIISQARLSKAKRLLLESNLSMQRISEQVHFGSQASFTRFFRSHTNLSPSAYRKTFSND